LVPFRFDLADYPILVQFLARFLLWGIHVRAWFQLALAVDQRQQQQRASVQQLRIPSTSMTVGSYLLLITACQFHIPFYASRMLPNTFALILVLYCYAAWLRQQTSWAAAWLVFATAVFRCDLLLLLCTVGLSWLLTRQLNIIQALRIGVMTGLVSLLITTPLDSLLWKQSRQWVWPEGQVFWYNTVLGKSKEWGVLPWHWYLSSAIPKAMLATLVLVPLSVLHLQRTGPPLPHRHGFSTRILQYVDTTWLPYLLPIGAFVGLYSLLGHKEMRFIFPAMPMLNLAAAVGVSKLQHLSFSSNIDGDRSYAGTSKKHDDHDHEKTTTRVAWLRVWVCRALWAGGIVAMVVTLLGSMTFLSVSTWNYPGGMALSTLIRHVGAVPITKTEELLVKVHVDVASAMSGVSLFGQREAVVNGMRRGRKEHWTFDKGGYEEEHTRQDLSQFTHLLSEQPQVAGFHMVKAIPGKPRLDIRRLRIATEDAIYILERNKWQ
jgi:alpha-1,6-mannosyltransferase